MTLIRWSQLIPRRDPTRPDLSLTKPGHFDDSIIFVPIIEPPQRIRSRDDVKAGEHGYLVEYDKQARVFDSLVVVGLPEKPRSSWILHKGRKYMNIPELVGRENLPNKVFVFKGPETAAEQEDELLRSLRSLNLEIAALQIATNPDSYTIQVRKTGELNFLR